MKDLFNKIENQIKENFDVVGFKEFTKYWVWTVTDIDGNDLKIKMDKPVISFEVKFDSSNRNYKNFYKSLQQEGHLVL